MKALQFASYGGPDVLHVDEAPEPHAGPGQIRISVRAAGVNPMDWKIYHGYLAQGQPLSGTGYLGFEASGVVDEVGEGVTGVAVGDDVFGLGPHAAADFAVLEAWAAKPASVDWAVAAAAGIATETSIRALDLLGVGSGSTVFVDGGAGGVGAVGVQVAVARGAEVIASASEDNQGYLAELGATGVVYGDGVADRVLALAADGVDGVFDVVGKTPATELVRLVAEPSQVVSIANFSGEAGIRATGGGDSDRAAALAEAAERLQQNTLVIKVQTFPLERAAEAYAVSESGHVRGKLVLLP
jgi:NADPH:quinone reductase-like Zn-dependent oxidoreductase